MVTIAAGSLTELIDKVGGHPHRVLSVFVGSIVALGKEDFALSHAVLDGLMGLDLGEIAEVANPFFTHGLPH